MLKQLKKLALLATMALSVAMVGNVASAESPTLDRIIKKGELRVGMSGNQPPYNAKSRTGQMIGLEVDLATAMAGAMGVELTIVNKPFGDLLNELNKGKVDMVMSGVSITPERAREVAFVGPYLLSGKSILTRDQTLAGAQSPAAFNQPHLQFAVLANSTSEAFVTRNLPEAKIVRIEDYDEGVRKVLDGSVSALVADMPICQLAVLRFPEAGLMTLNQPMTIEPVGIALSGNDAQFKNLIENYFATFERMGVLTQLSQKWLQDNSWVAALP